MADSKKTTENVEEVEEILFTEDQVKGLIKDAVDVALKDYIERTADPGITLGQKGVMNPAQLAAAQAGADIVVVSDKKPWYKRAYEKVARTVYEHPVATVMLSAAAGCACKTAWDKAHAGTSSDDVTIPALDDGNTFDGYMPQ